MSCLSFTYAPFLAAAKQQQRCAACCGSIPAACCNAFGSPIIPPNSVFNTQTPQQKQVALTRCRNERCDVRQALAAVAPQTPLRAYLPSSRVLWHLTSSATAALHVRARVEGRATVVTPALPWFHQRHRSCAARDTLFVRCRTLYSPHYAGHGPVRSALRSTLPVPRSSFMLRASPFRAGVTVSGTCASAGRGSLLRSRAPRHYAVLSSVCSGCRQHSRPRAQLHLRVSSHLPCLVSFFLPFERIP